MTAARGAGRLRVAHISLGLEIGGQEKLLVEFVRHADLSRFEVTVISLTGRGRMANAIEDLGGTVIALDEPPGIRPSMVHRLHRLFVAQRFDAVHTHDERPLLYAGTAAWLARTPVRVHTHHHGELGPLSPTITRILCAAARCVDPFVCVSNESAKYVVELGVPAPRVQIKWNGIDLVRFPFNGPKLDGVALCIGRLSPEKGHMFLLEAVCRVVEKLPTFRVDVAGDGSLREQLLTRTTELQLQRNVRFLGEVGDVRTLLRDAGMFVLPSLSEGLSITLLEAMASGLPVIATRVGGNPEVIQDGGTGLLVSPQDPEALAEALLDLASHPEKARRFGSAGRERARSHFDVRHMVAWYESIYAREYSCINAPYPHQRRRRSIRGHCSDRGGSGP
jgi:glycosyltransferase involved in cell wall biosynthesis